ncbi:MAG TPA: TatD family hydrolase [Gammaproteobacteria bacterium]|nr:TatD family hydrolase [Gammaproteobacteria bacterium]
MHSLIDIGANLTHESFQPDLEQVLERASTQGIGPIVVTGASASGNVAALNLTRRFSGLYCTAGVHPHEASHYTEAYGSELRLLGSAPEIVAMGECGLDFYRDLSPRQVQERCFSAQLEIACEIGKPVFLHERDAHDRFVAILGPFLKMLPKVVVHCFTGTRSQLETYLQLGCYIGITGWICDERRGHGLKDFIGLVPPDRLMVESDAPYLLPRTIKPPPKSRRNEPCYLPYVVEAIADAVGKTCEQVAAETTATAKEFFNLK